MAMAAVPQSVLGRWGQAPIAVFARAPRRSANAIFARSLGPGLPSTCHVSDQAHGAVRTRARHVAFPNPTTDHADHHRGGCRLRLRGARVARAARDPARRSRRRDHVRLARTGPRAGPRLRGSRPPCDGARRCRHQTPRSNPTEVRSSRARCPRRRPRIPTTRASSPASHAETRRRAARARRRTRATAVVRRPGAAAIRACRAQPRGRAAPRR